MATSHHTTHTHQGNIILLKACLFLERCDKNTESECIASLKLQSISSVGTVLKKDTRNMLLSSSLMYTAF